MRFPRHASTLLFAASLVACSTPPAAPSAATPVEPSDAVLTDLALPNPAINQRPITGVKTALLVAAHWPGDRELDMPKLYDSSFSGQPLSLSHYLLKASGGKLVLKGTTISARFTEPVPPEGFWGEINAAKAAARAQGYEPDNYDYFFVVHKNGVGGAQASMPGNHIVLRDQPFRGHYLWAHEFGHNLGFSHENKFGGLFDTYINCPGVGVDMDAPSGCATKRYGDTGDPVQGSNGVQALYPAHNRWYAGWLDDTQMAVINQTGLYRLGVLGGVGPQLYLLNRLGSSTIQPLQIALEYRQPGPPYDNFAVDDNRVNGVWMRYTTLTTRVDNVQLDATPETLATDDPALQIGRVVNDPAAKLKVRLCSNNTQGATIAVAVDNQPLPTCTPELPGVVVAQPAANQKTGYRPFVSGTGLPGAVAVIEKTREHYMVGVVGSAIVRADGKWSVQLDEPLAAGKQRLAAYLVNSGSKNGGASYSPSFTVIETPDAAIVHVPANNSQTTPYPTFSGSGLAGATVSVAMLANGLPSDVIASALVDEQGNWSAQSATPFSNGNHRVTFYQKNGERQSAGNPTRDFFVSEKARRNP
jgi:hypothetical protein